jgi:quinol-cytochrome oxidoreductase complex cytochrome b subunit
VDHKEQHHQKHVHEREEEKKEQKEHEREDDKSWLPFHPAWLVGIGVVLVVAAVLIWTFLLV